MENDALMEETAGRYFQSGPILAAFGKTARNEGTYHKSVLFPWLGHYAAAVFGVDQLGHQR